MAYNIHYVFVEGSDDQLFVDRILVPRMISAGFDHAQTVPWGQDPKGKRKEFISSVKGMAAQYSVLIDQDGLCVTLRKQRYLKRHPFVDPDRLLVVCAEIEAWYAAGAPRNLGRLLTAIGNVNQVTKEHFERIAPQIASDAALAKLQLLAEYDFDAALTRNNSLAYAVRRLFDPPKDF